MLILIIFKSKFKSPQERITDSESAHLNRPTIYESFSLFEDTISQSALAIVLFSANVLVMAFSIIRIKSRKLFYSFFQMKTERDQNQHLDPGPRHIKSFMSFGIESPLIQRHILKLLVQRCRKKPNTIVFVRTQKYFQFC